MKTQEILTIVALSALGLCLLCGLAKMAMKNPKKRSDCDKACGALFFVAVALLAVGQLLGETHKISGFEMGAEGKKPENCVMKAKSVADEYKKGQMAKLAKARNNVMKKAKEIHDKELSSCEAGGHSKHHHSKHHKHHKHHKHRDGDTLVCYDYSGMYLKPLTDAGYVDPHYTDCYLPPRGTTLTPDMLGGKCPGIKGGEGAPPVVMTKRQCMSE